MMVSLDGFIEGPGKELDWHFVDREFEEYSNDMLRSSGGILLGRKIYKLFVDYWPAAAENPAGAADQEDSSRHIEAARMLNDLPKYVVSTTMKNAEWTNSHIINGNLSAEITKLKDQTGRDIALFGGALLAQTLMKLHLVDEIRLIVNPVILGGGTPLFNSGISGTILKLLKVKTFNSGAVLMIYRPEHKSTL